MSAGFFDRNVKLKKITPFFTELSVERGGQVLVAQLQGQLVDALYAQRRADYTCPACHQRVGLRHGTRVQPYFAHRPQSPCSILGEGETAQHIAGKRQLAAFFADGGAVTLEHVLPQIQQRADCWVARSDRPPLALEFQCSPIATQQVWSRTRGYQRLGVYPLWILGSRYGRQKLGWSLIERFALPLRGWGLCLLFWDVRQQRLRIDHHLYQDALGNYHGHTTWLVTLAGLIAGYHQPLPQVVLNYPVWRSRLARDLHLKTPAIMAIQEQLYPLGHHLLDIPAVLATTAQTVPLFGQGLLTWRALVAARLFALPTPKVTVPTVNHLATSSFAVVGGHLQAVRVTATRSLEIAKRQLMADLVSQGYLRAMTDGWVIRRPLRWLGED